MAEVGGGEGTALTRCFPASREAAREKVDFDLKAYKGMGEHLMVVDDLAGQRQLGTAIRQRMNF